MAIKLYTDEHVVPAVVNALRKQGLDVLTAQEAQMLNAPDEEYLRFAISQGRSIFTQDADFLRLHARQIKHRYLHSSKNTNQANHSRFNSDPSSIDRRRDARSY